MGGQPCPNCDKGFLVRTGKGRKRCRHCGYLKHDSPNRREQGTILYPEDEKKEEKKEDEVPKIQGKYHAIPRGKGYHTEEYQSTKFMRDQQIKLTNKMESIQKILKELRKRNKYSKIKIIEIEGELWDVESGKLVREKEKPEEEEKEEFTPDRIIEDMVTKESG